MFYGRKRCHMHGGSGTKVKFINPMAYEKTKKLIKGYAKIILES